jgi:hypothetical protein
MFGFLKKKKPGNALDEFIFAVWGNPPPPKRANLEMAITLADQLLIGLVSQHKIREHAIELHIRPMPYSTHELAISVAGFFFIDPLHIAQLGAAQLQARETILKWQGQGLVVPILAKSFEDELFSIYKTRC